MCIRDRCVCVCVCSKRKQQTFLKSFVRLFCMCVGSLTFHTLYCLIPRTIGKKWFQNVQVLTIAQLEVVSKLETLFGLLRLGYKTYRLL